MPALPPHGHDLLASLSETGLGLRSMEERMERIGGNYLKATQTEVTLIQEKGLSKSPLLFIDLGLTFIGHDQEDMKEGLLIKWKCQ